MVTPIALVERCDARAPTTTTYSNVNSLPACTLFYVCICISPCVCVVFVWVHRVCFLYACSYSVCVCCVSARRFVSVCLIRIAFSLLGGACRSPIRATPAVVIFRSSRTRRRRNKIYVSVHTRLLSVVYNRYHYYYYYYYYNNYYHNYYYYYNCTYARPLGFRENIPSINIIFIIHARARNSLA